MLSQVHLAHPAFTDLRNNLVAPGEQLSYQIIGVGIGAEPCAILLTESLLVVVYRAALNANFAQGLTFSCTTDGFGSAAFLATVRRFASFTR
jgi:hypothetical protein